MKDKKLQEVLTEIREIAGMDAALFSDAAELLVAPFSDMNIRKTDVKAFLSLDQAERQQEEFYYDTGSSLCSSVTADCHRNRAGRKVSSLSDTESAFIRNTADEPGAVHFRGIAWKVGTDRGFKYDAKTAHCIFCMDGLCPSDAGKDRDRLYGDLKKSFL